MSRLFLRELKLSHFRSHKAARFVLDGRPVAIHGPNGAGKTNILEAVSLLSPGRGMRRVAAAEMTRRPEALGWKVSAVVDSGGRVNEVETWSEQGAARSVQVDGKAATQVQLGRIARVLWLLPSMDRLWIEGAEGRRRFLDRMTLSFEPAHAEATITYEKAMRERNRLLKEQIGDPHWYRALEAQMAVAGSEIIANRKRTVAALTTAQRAAGTAFPVADLTLLFAEGAAHGPESEDDLLDALREGRPLDLRAGRTLAGPHRADLGAVYAAKGIPAKDCSTGEQKALLVSLILANGRALAEEVGAPPILLLDEIAAHLDASRRAALYDEICALGAQAFMTGTGPELFEELGSRAAAIEVTERGGVSEARLLEG
ncbi:DNA replication and repair protein RecF [Pseudoruegeria aquimaris]|uniref:DNA replication and repair protein RecF n=1 Tax=Pseudoruegeria aquimaris TaxID=393663 RepID=A0A1Y5RS17_9RHOB|nr:DNA replication/repair protein RecF [Pseudoruegeria aquimaris]SLN23809.1 DNA replication and repair protein RecF [Pseudoruegeria aquimaris]